MLRSASSLLVGFILIAGCSAPPSTPETSSSSTQSTPPPVDEKLNPGNATRWLNGTFTAVLTEGQVANQALSQDEPTCFRVMPTEVEQVLGGSVVATWDSPRNSRLVVIAGRPENPPSPSSAEGTSPLALDVTPTIVSDQGFWVGVSGPDPGITVKQSVTLTYSLEYAGAAEPHLEFGFC